ncbi:arylsulfotransferase family protein [Algiphilus sp.]|uniref:arylsulfotransferase family protein n=1 Tax=Algiphilus sp. TaxID=1872431 RepID=UPI0025C30108|nr:arylsulfotransferase family protein [Algiphilus sp.]MCK5770413.1 hypothetical protein [Algiphilus sp.]
MSRYALIYLGVLVCLAYGYAIGRHEVFPHAWIETVRSEIRYLRNDLSDGVERFLVPYTPSDASGFAPAAPGRYAFGSTPAIRTGDGAVAGYRALMGSFDFNPPGHAIVLLDAGNAVRHVWRLQEEVADGGPEVRPDANKFPHGMEILPDGSVVFAYDGGASLQRFDVCGTRMWRLPGRFHHSVTLDADRRHVWTLLDAEGSEPDPSIDVASRRFLVRVALDDGEIERRISLRQIMDANPGIDILGLHQTDLEERYEWRGDAFHENDIDPLPRELADAFPRFEAGDLLLSMRSLDLVFVLDPDDLAVKWWRIGQVRRQHDPDWQPDGSITIYDNDMHRGPLRIVRIEPENYRASVLYEGRRHGAQTWFRGRHQRLPNGNLLITVPQQGRVLEVAPDGALVFELLNRYRPQPGRNLLVSEARWLPLDYFDFEEFPSCES